MSFHPANEWVKSLWMGKTVQQKNLVDADGVKRTSTVVNVIFDEKGACHINTADGYWCPALLMEVEA